MRLRASLADEAARSMRATARFAECCSLQPLRVNSRRACGATVHRKAKTRLKMHKSDAGIRVGPRRGGIRPSPLSRLFATVEGARERGTLESAPGPEDRRGRFVQRYLAKLHGNCSQPFMDWSKGRPEMFIFPGRLKGVLLRATFRCRRCKWCRAMRTAEWGHRAVREYERAAATWIGCLELDPFEHAAVDLIRDQSWTDRDGVFAARVRVMSKYVTRWLDKVRIQRRRDLGRAPDFSYLLVAEEHDGKRLQGLAAASPNAGALTGYPHFHLLLHEGAVGELIPEAEWYTTAKGIVRADDKSALRLAWPFRGWTRFEKLDADEAWRCRYVCKYLGKQAQPFRIRASLGYGGELAESEATAVRSDV